MIRLFNGTVMEQPRSSFSAPPSEIFRHAPRDCLRAGFLPPETGAEFMGYLALTHPDTVVAERSFVIATYALCGFANFSSIAIQIGGIGSLAASTRPAQPDHQWNQSQ